MTFIPVPKYIATQQIIDNTIKQLVSQSKHSKSGHKSESIVKKKK
jgi:hypothetical protein